MNTIALRLGEQGSPRKTCTDYRLFQVPFVGGGETGVVERRFSLLPDACRHTAALSAFKFPSYRPPSPVSFNPLPSHNHANTSNSISIQLALFRSSVQASSIISKTAPHSPLSTMNPRVYWGLGITGGIAAIIITRMGMHAQDRQYQKTLKYMQKPEGFTWGK
jgi:hypothetical protein